MPPVDTNGEAITVELLMTYGFDKEHAEASIRLADDYNNKAIKLGMAAEEKAQARLAVSNMEKARLAYNYRVELAEKLAKKEQEIAEKNRPKNYTQSSFLDVSKPGNGIPNSVDLKSQLAGLVKPPTPAISALLAKDGFSPIPTQEELNSKSFDPESTSSKIADLKSEIFDLTAEYNKVLEDFTQKTDEETKILKTELLVRIEDRKKEAEAELEILAKQLSQEERMRAEAEDKRLSAEYGATSGQSQSDVSTLDRVKGNSDAKFAHELSPEEAGKEFEKLASSGGYDGSNKSFDDAAKSAKSEAQEVKELDKEIASLARTYNLTETQVRELTDEQYKNLKVNQESVEEAKKNTASIRALYSTRLKDLRIERQEIEQQKYAIQRATQVFAAFSAVGVAGVFGLQRLGDGYVQFAKASGTVNEVTKEWAANTDKVQEAQARVGKVAAQAILPLMTKVAELAESGSKFLQAHPDIAKAGLNLSIATAVIGAVGILATQGVRMLVDAKQIAVMGAIVVTERELIAALAANTIAVEGKTAGGAISSIAGAGGAGGVVGKILGGLGVESVGALAGAVLPYILVTGVIVSIAAIAYDFISKKIGGPGLAKTVVAGSTLATSAFEKYAVSKGMSQEEATNKSKRFLYLISELTGAIDEQTPIWERIKKVVDKNTESLSSAGDEFGKTAEEAQKFADELKAAQNILDNLTLENKRADEQYARDKLKINEDARRQELAISASAAKAMLDVTNRLKDEQTKIMASGAADLAKMDADYNKSRSDVAQSGKDELVKIEKDKNEQLRKLEEGHNERVQGLLAARDALGLVKEERDYLKQKAEINNNASELAKERRAETQRQLQELKYNYKLQRAERIKNMNEQLAEAKKQAADQKKQIYLQKKEELAQLAAAKNEQLKQLSVAYNEERRRRYEQASLALKDLDVSLINERLTKNKYYAAMLADVNAFGKAYQNSLNAYISSHTPGASTNNNGSAFGGSTGGVSGGTSGRAGGGYIENEQTYKIGEGGLREYVLGHSAVTAAERMIGGRLSQSSLLSIIAKGTKKSVTLNDARKFNASVPASERRAIAKETSAMILEALGNA